MLDIAITLVYVAGFVLVFGYWFDHAQSRVPDRIFEALQVAMIWPCILFVRCLEQRQRRKSSWPYARLKLPKEKSK